jgi:hypothetical protein
MMNNFGGAHGMAGNERQVEVRSLGQITDFLHETVGHFRPTV